jgi:hypothetical protein
LEGAQNHYVDSRGSFEDLVKQIVERLGRSFTAQIWKDADSLARRAILHIKQKRASTKQTSIEDYVK